jgi:hypothetical protein
MKRAKPNPIGLKKATDLMRAPGAKLVCMTSNEHPAGIAHYIVPGGYVDPAVAQRIKDRPDVVGGADGLFPGQDQTWKVITQ